MTNSKSTKRALFSSALACILCVAMLVSTTFAWFTDNATANVNRIKSGTLQVDLVDKDGRSITDTGLSFVNADESTDILWEPGVTFNTTEFKIKNKGELALKYKLQLNGIDGDADLLRVIDFSVIDSEGTKVALSSFEGNLSANATSGLFRIQGKMDTAADNAYQDKVLEGISITVYATQYTEESDSINNQYDSTAEYAIPVSTESELLNTFENGGSVAFTEDITVSTSVPKVENGVADSRGRNATYIKEDTNIDLGGNTLTLNDNNILTATDGAKVTISNGIITGNCNNLVWSSKGADVTLTNCKIVASNGHGVAARRAEGDSGAYSKLTLNNCTIEAKESCVTAMNGGTVVINGGNYTSADNYVVGTNGTDSYSGNNITINGGTFTGSIVTTGYVACGIYMAHEGDVVTVNGGTFHITNGVGLCARYGAATVSNSVQWNVTGDASNTGKVGAQGAYRAGYTYDGVAGTVNGETNYH